MPVTSTASHLSPYTIIVYIKYSCYGHVDSQLCATHSICAVDNI